MQIPLLDLKPSHGALRREPLERRPQFFVSLSPHKIVLVLLFIIMILMLMHLTTQGIRLFTGHDHQRGFAHQFNLGDENNIPTWFASSMLFLCSALLALIWLRTKQMAGLYSAHWFVLSITFFGLSVDESASLHEMILDPIGIQVTSDWIREKIQINGYFTFGWVIPATVFVIAFGLSYVGFLRYLPTATRWLFLLAGFIYVGGALGFEMLEANEWSSAGTKTLFYAVCVAIEEGLEMVGILIFIHALLSHLAMHTGTVTLVLQNNSNRTVLTRSTSE